MKKLLLITLTDKINNTSTTYKKKTGNVRQMVPNVTSNVVIVPPKIIQTTKKYGQILLKDFSFCGTHSSVILGDQYCTWC